MASSSPIQPSLVSNRATIFVLFITTAVLLSGGGLFGTLLGVRATVEDFPTSATGLIMSAYFAGFILGAFLCVRIVSEVGHIRAFAAFAALSTAMALAHVLWVDMLPWAVFRFIHGIAMVGLALIIESWLNAKADANSRGRVFAIYMVVNLAALAVGQLLLTIGEAENFKLFALVAILFALSLVPTALVRVRTPEVHQPTGLGLGELIGQTSSAVAGCFAMGVIGGAFWGMAPVMVTELGYDEDRTAIFMFAAIVGGMLLQIPLGRWSDGRDRRHVLAAVAALAAVASAGVLLATGAPFGALAGTALVFGAFYFPLYGLAVARAHDVLRPEQALEATRGLMLVFGIGAALGPFLAGLVMGALGPSALFGWFASVFAGFAVFAIWRITCTPTVPAAKQSVYHPMLATSHEAVELVEGPAPNPKAV